MIIIVENQLIQTNSNLGKWFTTALLIIKRKLWILKNI